MEETRRATSVAIVCLVFGLDGATLVMANIALPTIKKALDFDASAVQWVLTSFALTFGGFLLTFGRLCDIFGFKAVLLGGMTIFNASSLLCALVNNRVGLLVGRALQGLGAAAAVPSAQSILSATYDDPHRRNIAFAAWGASGALGYTVGPIIGGLFTSLVSWEWIFWFVLIFEGLLELLAIFVLHSKVEPAISAPSDAAVRSRVSWGDIAQKTDVLGSCLSVSGLILLVYALTTADEIGWAQPAVVATLVVSVLVLAALVFVELRVAQYPLVPRHLWRDVAKLCGFAMAALVYAVWMGVNYILTLELQEFGFSPLGTALRFIPLGLVALLVNVLVPPLMKSAGPRNMLIGSWVMALAGISLLAAMKSAEDYWRLCLPGMILYTAGIVVIYYLGNVVVVATAAAGEQGTISGIYNMCLNIGGAVMGIALTTLLIDAVASKSTSEVKSQARLEGFRAGYYFALALSLTAVVPSLCGMLNGSHATPQDKEEGHGSEVSC